MRLRIALAASAALLVTGCVSLGMSQAQSESLYTIAATGTDAAILLGKLGPDAAGQACVADNLNYSNLIATRNVADGSSYVAADNAHAKLQADGFKLSPLCTPPPPPT